MLNMYQDEVKVEETPLKSVPFRKIELFGKHKGFAVIAINAKFKN